MNTVFRKTTLLILTFTTTLAFGWEPQETTVSDPVKERSDYHNKSGSYAPSKSTSTSDNSSSSHLGNNPGDNDRDRPHLGYGPYVSGSLSKGYVDETLRFPEPVRSIERDILSGSFNKGTASSIIMDAENSLDRKYRRQIEAVKRGHQNAEFGYRGVEPSSLYHGSGSHLKGPGLQVEYARDFYRGTYSYVRGKRIDPYNNKIAVGLASQKAISSLGYSASKLSKNQRKHMTELDRGFRKGTTMISTKDFPFTGRITRLLDDKQLYALDNSIVAVTTDGKLMGKISGISSREAFGVNMATLISFSPGGVNIINVDSLSDIWDPDVQDTLAHELSHSAELAAFFNAGKLLNSGNYPSDKRSLIFDGYLAAEALRADGTTLEDVALQKTLNQINGIDPDYLAAVDDYLRQLTEINAFLSEPNSLGRGLTNRMQNLGISRVDAEFITKELRRSPVLNELNRRLDRFIAWEMKVKKGY